MDDLFTEKKFFLLDAMALIYRAHFALIRSPRFTSRGQCTSAVFGVANTVLDIIKNQQPTHMMVAWDTQEPTFRHEEFPEYKAQRDELPEDIGAQFPLVDKLFEAFNIPSLRLPGFEADDIIGTIVTQLHENSLHAFMVTPDKDYAQLVSDRISIFKPGRQGAEHEILGVPEILAKWNIQRVDQVIDILGLMGDASDNIPGVPGYGEKTAQKLIAQFGSIEELIRQSGQLKGKLKERIETHADQALLSKRLVTINREVPLNCNLSDFHWVGHDDQKLKELFAEIEFDTLGKRLFGHTFSAAPKRQALVREAREKEVQRGLFDDQDDPAEDRQIDHVQHDYQAVTTKPQREQLLKMLLKQKSVCFDMEATGLDPRTAEPLGISFCFQPHQAWYLVLPEDLEKARQVLQQFQPFFVDPAIEKIGHNLKYDIELLRWNGIRVSGWMFDSMLAHSLIEPEMQHGMDYLAKIYLGYQPIPISDLIGPKGDPQRSMRDVPLPILVEYACEDADITWQLATIIRQQIEKHQATKVCFEVEFPLIPVLVEMEHEGINLNVASLRAYSAQLAQEIETLERMIFQAAGRRFNIASPKQLGEVLYDELNLVSNPKKTATGQYSTREEELLRLAGKHQIVADVLDFRNASKLKSTYVDTLPDAIDSRTGRLHTHYSQTWTTTGRMQSNDPNLQTIPVRKERGREIRAAFVPRNDDYAILAADYSQIELRIMAALSQDPGMLEAFQENLDIHTATAAKVYHVSLEEVTREQRSKAKMVNFGILYGISSYGLQQRLNVSRQEASDLIKNYFDMYPGVNDFIKRTIQFARQHQYVETVTGRRRYLRDINSRNKSLAAAAERLAMNSPIQGTAADMLKLSMIKIAEAMSKNDFQTKMLLTVHDEIVFDLYLPEQEAILPVIKKCMVTALPLSVPIEVELGIGANWLEAH